jgi:hypothetical protein
VTSAEVGLPGRPTTQRPCERPIQTGFPGLIATFVEQWFKVLLGEHRLGIVALANRCAASHHHNVGQRKRASGQMPQSGQIIRPAQPRLDPGTKLLSQRGHAKRHGFGDFQRDCPAPIRAAPVHPRWQQWPPAAACRPGLLRDPPPPA